jgi:hypothetical protein
LTLSPPREISRTAVNQLALPYTKPFQSSQKRLPLFQAITVSPKPTLGISSYSSQAKNDFINSKPFQSGQKQLPSFNFIPVRPKCASSRQAITVWPTLSINPLSSPCRLAAGHRTIQFLFQVLIVI